MALPDGVSQAALLARLRGLRREAEQSAPPVPPWARDVLDQLLVALTGQPPDVKTAASFAGGILRWYYDEGFAEVPAHAALAEAALSLVKMAQVQSALTECEALRARPDAPGSLPQILALLAALRAGFSREGRLDEARYDALAPRLRELARPDHAYYEQHARAVLQV